MKQTRRLYGVDLLRLWAVANIFLFHAAIHMDCKYGFLSGFINNGAIFMILFFMISGFVLYYTNSDNQILTGGGVLNFYYKRISVLYPAYFVICAIYLLWDQELTPLKKIILLPMDLSLMQSSVDGSFSTWHHGGTWFISCLFFCYVLSPFIISMLGTISSKGCIILASGLGAMDAYIGLATHILEYSNIYSNMIFRAMEFVIGMCLAKFCTNSKSDNSKNLTKSAFLAVALTVGISALSFLGGGFCDYGFFAIPVFCLLLKNSAFLEFDGVWQRIVQCRIFSYANKIAYEFFLAQFFCFKITNGMNLHSSFLKTVVAFLICVIIAIALHEIISRPGKRVLLKVYSKISNIKE